MYIELLCEKNKSLQYGINRIKTLYIAKVYMQS